MVNRIVRNNKIFESEQDEWECLLTIDMSSSSKIFRLYTACRYIRKLIDENKCPGLVSVDAMLRGKCFVKGSDEINDIIVGINNCDPQDKRYIQIKYIPICFTFNKPVADVDITIHVMDIVYSITEKYHTFNAKVIRDDDLEYNDGVFCKLDNNGNYSKISIEWVYNFINNNRVDLKNSLPNDEIIKYDKTIKLSNYAKYVFKSIKYDFKKHDIYLKDEDCKGYAAVYLTVPIGKTVKDSEITRICKIYEDFIYADYEPKDVCIHINIEGTLIATVDTPYWLVKPQNSVFISNLDNRTNLTDEEYLNQR